MNLGSDKLKIVLYSSIFIIFSSLCLLKISSQLFIIFYIVPLFLVALVINIKLIPIIFLISTLSLLVILKNGLSINNHIHSYISINLIITSILAFVLIKSLESGNVKSSNIGLAFAWFNLLVSLIVFLFIFYTKNLFNESSLREIKNTYLNNLNLENEQLIDQIGLLIDTTYPILPFLNALSFILITILNLTISYKLISILKFRPLIKISFDNFFIPNWYLYIFCFVMLSYFLSPQDFSSALLNTFLTTSILFVFKGNLIFLKILNKFNINSYLKLLLLFLLFIFFSYLLVIFLFVLGLINKIDDVYKSIKDWGKENANYFIRKFW